MKTSSIVTTDNQKIIYDVVGEGEAIILLHGGGGDQTRKRWHEQGYVDRLKTQFKVITIDIRGHGESDKPTQPEGYSIDQMCQDILSVADACQVEKFAIWGFSYGGNIGRFLAMRSSRVKKIVIMGIPMGLAAQGEFRQFINDFSAHWQPILNAQNENRLDIDTLSDKDKALLDEMDISVFLGWIKAMLEWGSVEPVDLDCPVLWLAGSKNEGTIESMQLYEDQIKKSTTQIFVLDRLTHMQEFEEIDLVFPKMLDFTVS